MKRLLTLILVAAVIAGCDGKCFASTFRWGVEPQFRWGVEPVSIPSDSSEFGLGIFAKVQDCPNGLCPLPGQVQMQWPPQLRPRTTIKRTVTQLGVGAFSTEGLPLGSVLVSVKDSNGNELLPNPVMVDCPNCPMTVDMRTVTRQPVFRRYNAQWTFPGDLDSHLMGAPHYVSAAQLAGMSYDQKLALHDQQHNSGIGSGRIRTAWSNRPRLFSGRIVQWFRARRGR